MSNLPRQTLALLIAIAATIALASVAATQGALAALSELPLAAEALTLGVRLETTLSDLVGLFTVGSVPIAITVALLLGWLITALILRLIPAERRPSLRTLGYTLAGAVAILAMHQLLSAAFGGIVPLAAARTTLGLFWQALAGAAGGWLFARLSAPRT